MQQHIKLKKYYISIQHHMFHMNFFHPTLDTTVGSTIHQHTTVPDVHKNKRSNYEVRGSSQQFFKS
jgi:hypothetical protein